MAKNFLRFRVNSYSRVSAEFSADATYGEALVTVRTDQDNPWQIEMSPYAARRLARQLTKLADVIEPPKRRAK